MRSFMDCPSCACLIDSRETACPFCAASVRSTGASAWLALGLALGVGVADVSCGGKGDGGDETVTASGVTYAGPDESGSNSNSEGGSTTIDPTNASGVTYAGPDESWSASEPTTTTGPNTTTGTTTTGDGSTYAGPDESSGTTDASSTGSSGSSGSTDAGTSSGTDGGTGAGSSG